MTNVVHLPRRTILSHTTLLWPCYTYVGTIQWVKGIDSALIPACLLYISFNYPQPTWVLLEQSSSRSPAEQIEQHPTYWIHCLWTKEQRPALLRSSCEHQAHLQQHICSFSSSLGRAEPASFILLGTAMFDCLGILKIGHIKIAQ